jgi:hypothetical protein
MQSKGKAANGQSFAKRDYWTTTKLGWLHQTQQYWTAGEPTAIIDWGGGKSAICVKN